MNSIRIAIAAAALSATSLAFAGNVNAAQMFGRDVPTQGVVAVPHQPAAQWLDAVPGRQGFVQNLERAVPAKAGMTATVELRIGRA